MAVINYSLEAVIETAAVLATLNPVLLNGQLGKESDTGKFKVGNGVLAWNSIDLRTCGSFVSMRPYGGNSGPEIYDPNKAFGTGGNGGTDGGWGTIRV